MTLEKALELYEIAERYNVLDDTLRKLLLAIAVSGDEGYRYEDDEEDEEDEEFWKEKDNSLEIAARYYIAYKILFGKNRANGYGQYSTSQEISPYPYGYAQYF